MQDALIIALLMAISNALIRMIPVGILSGRKLTPTMLIWLKYVPVPVLCAMLAPDLLTENGALNIHFSNCYLWVAVPSFLVAYKSKNMFLTVLFGVALLALLRLLVP